MKYLFLILTTLTLVFCFSSETQGQTQTWEHYFNEFKRNDPYLQFYFPEPNRRMKDYYELSGKERRMVKRRLKDHYDIRPSAGGYLVGTFKTVGKAIGRTIIYIATAAAATYVIATMLNRTDDINAIELPNPQL